MALAHCILGSFLGVGCHWFPPPLDFPLSPLGASTYKRHERPLSAKDGITGEKWPVSFACDFDFHVNSGFFDMPRKSATWETALLPPVSKKKAGGDKSRSPNSKLCCTDTHLSLQLTILPSNEHWNLPLQQTFSIAYLKAIAKRLDYRRTNSGKLWEHQRHVHESAMMWPRLHARQTVVGASVYGKTSYNGRSWYTLINTFVN